MRTYPVSLTEAKAFTKLVSFKNILTQVKLDRQIK